MKIDIGPYRNWFGPYQIAETLLFWMDKEDDRVGNLGDRLARMIWLCKFCEWVDSKKKRKINVRIDHYDVWNADHTLALIIAPLLRKLEKHGTPATDREDAPADPIYDDVETDNDWDRPYSENRWEYILGEMIYAFEMKIDEDWDLEIYKNGGWSEENLEKRRAIQERINNGFRLFGKYYNNLWT